jgi:formylglycine-generating enzyme required for sulfatase activity
VSSQQTREAAKSFTGPAGVKMVSIPGGKFAMGSSAAEVKIVQRLLELEEAPWWLKAQGPRHEVEVSSFYLGVYEVTQKQFREVMGYNPSCFSNNARGQPGWRYGLWQPGDKKEKVKGENTEEFPVENVCWEEAKEFCRRLTKLEKKRGGSWSYRLPTEAEWEYACRAGTKGLYYSGNREADLKKAGWYWGNSEEKTHPVGRKEKNSWGLCDMHGNVWECCEDRFAEDYYSKSPKKNPPGPSTGEYRVLRGGSYGDYAGRCVTASRTRMGPRTRADFTGFRVLATSSRGK